MAINDLKVLVVIPARGGSKGLPGKNIKEICGKPLIAWSIEQAKESKYTDRIIVSTDCSKIADVAKNYGADVPFLRPAKLAQDTSSVAEAILDVIKKLEEKEEYYDIVVSLEPTKCIRESSDIDESITKLVSKSNAKSLVSLVPIENPSHPDWAAKLNEKGFVIGKDANLFRRQNLPHRYCNSGFILVAYTEHLKKEKTFWTDATLGFIIPEKVKTMDINDETDFVTTEAVMRKFLKEKESKKSFGGLTTVNVELTSLCNKNCWMCGRRKTERDYPELVLKYGNMDFELVKSIAKQLPEGIVVQLHNNGEPLVYPRFGDAVKLFNKQITNIVTNGKLLVEKADEIIGNLDTLAISVFENDSEAEEQYKIMEEFFKLKGNQKPNVIIRLNGDVDQTRYEKFEVPFAKRAIHAAMGSFNYKKDPIIPEIGICLDFLNHLAINKDGDVSICVRFDPKRLGVLGNLKEKNLEEIWNSKNRLEWLEYHKQGRRDKIPLCSYCHFWGVPTSGDGKNVLKSLDEENIFKSVGRKES